MSDIPSLAEILQNLALHCNLITNKECEIKVILPPQVLGEFSKIILPNEKIILNGSIEKPIMICKYVTISGTITLESQLKQ